MIELQKIAFSYGRETFLNDLDLSFPEGKITTIIGPNGCGKSTLLKLATGLLEPQSGAVMIDGRNIALMRAKDFAKRVSLLAQTNRPLQMRVRDVVMYGRYPYQTFMQPLAAKDKEIATSAMQRTGVWQLRDQTVDRLSGGERQRVYLAMALAQDTDVIFLDEPTTYLDINVSYEIMELIKKLNTDFGKTIVMVLHDLNLALNYSDQVVVMDRGRVVAVDRPVTIVSKRYIDDIFKLSVKCFSEDGKSYYCFDKR